jgi:hypothetical protein
VNSSYLAERLERLRRAQNADGGWSYYPGKRDSWLEPTAYAAFALAGEPEADRAWNLLKDWQQPSGGWRPAAIVPGANWTTALAVLLAQSRDAAAAERGAEWLRNVAHQRGWAWRSGNPAAAEPSALAIVALARAASQTRRVEKLVEAGSRFLLTADMSPETCGPVLVGLQGTSEAKALARVALGWAQETASPLTRAWIALGLKLNGVPVEDPGGAVPHNVAIVALEALAAQDGKHECLRMEVAA